MNKTNSAADQGMESEELAEDTLLTAKQPSTKSRSLNLAIEMLSPRETRRLVALQHKELKDLRHRLSQSEEKLKSIRYRLGSMIVDAFRQRGRKLWHLPADLIKLWRERPASKIEVPSRSKSFTQLQNDSNVEIPGDQGRKLLAHNPENTVLFLPINGTGLGHLTRSLAVANQLISSASDKQVIFLTTSVALPILFEREYLAYYVPPLSSFKDLLPNKEWNELFQDTIDSVIRIHRPGTIVFDGTYPYAGLRRSLETHSEIKSIWIKRGLYRPVNLSENLREFLDLFDRVVVPGELDGCNADLERPNAVSVSPIVYTPPEGQLSREQACRTLRLNPEQPIAYIQLGAGNINDLTEQLQLLIEVLNTRFPEMQLVLGESPISRSRLNVDGNYALLRDFPNSKYFKAFDVAVLAAGYNSVYETLFFGLPAVFLPNTVCTDNQLERARIAETFGVARIARELHPDAISALISDLLANAPYRSRHGDTFVNGAQQAARCIIETAASAANFAPGHRD